MKSDKESGLFYREWKSPSPKAILLLIHGLGAHSGRWDALGRFFLERSISSYAPELRGFGETKDRKGHIDSFDTYLADIKRITDIARDENTGKKIFLTGESLGALIGILAAKKEPSLYRGLICISPAFSSKIKFSFLNYIDMLAALLYNPQKQFTVPFDSAMCTRDKEYQKIMDSDEREHRLATPKLFVNTLIAQGKAASVKDWPDMPVLFLIAGEDKLVDTKASENVFKKLKIKDKKIIEYPGMYHSLSIELVKEKVFSDIDGWLERKI